MKFINGVLGSIQGFVMDEREGKTIPEYMDYLGEINLLVRKHGRHEVRHIAQAWRSYKTKYEASKSKYMPHQGKKEMARRKARMEATA